MKKEYITNSPNQTKKLGERLAKEILKRKSAKTAFVIGLKGELGGGKTTFIQGFAKGLEIEQKILSPTFVILKKFKISQRSHNSLKSRKASMVSKADTAFTAFYHIDCYRIQKPKELLDLGFKEIVSNPKNIVAIEWADRIKKILPKEILILKFRFIDEKRRKIVCG